jgi:DNA ligase-1
MFKVMLATDAVLDKLSFPLFASPKLDGIRCYVRTALYSRSNKLIPNRHVQEKFKHLLDYDGELIVGDPTSKTCYRDTVSVVMSDDKPADNVSFYTFDHVGKLHMPYRKRADLWGGHGVSAHVYYLTQTLIHNVDELLAMEEQKLEEGFEGLILRDPDGHYKCGRSTVKEGLLLKLKRFTDDEAEIIGFEERMHNANEARVNELGRTSRSSHKDGKVGRGDLGAFVLRTSKGITFSCGTGFTDDERHKFWQSRDSLLGCFAKYKHFAVGAKDAPRHPVFLGIRDKRDM